MYKVLMRMSQRMNRSQQNTEKAVGSQFGDGASSKGGAGSPAAKHDDADGDGDKDNPIVALEPEDNKYGF